MSDADDSVYEVHFKFIKDTYIFQKKVWHAIKTFTASSSLRRGRARGHYIFN